MRVIVALLVFAALSLAQVSEISSNSVHLGTLTPLLSGSGYQTQLNYYKVWIPENTLQVQTIFASIPGTSDTCDLYLWHHFQVVPCGSYFPVASGAVNPCTSSVSTESWSSRPSDTVSFGPTGSYNREADYTVGTYLYLAVNRYSDTYDSDACPYSIYVNVTTCPVNQTGVYDRFSQTIGCEYVNVLTPSGAKNSAGVSVSGTTAVIKLDLPVNVGEVSITALSNSSSTYIVASHDFAVSYTDYYEYYSGSGVANGSDYLITLDAYVARSGALYIVVADESSAFTAMVNVSYTVCSTGTGGYACTYTSKLLNGTALNGVTQYLNANPSAGLSNEGPIANFYFDFPVNSTMEANVTATANAGPSGYFYYKRNGFPEYSSSYGYDNYLSFSGSSASSVLLELTWHNFYPGGRIYLGVQNTDSSTPAINLNYTVDLTSGSGSTSGSTTSSSSGSTTSSSTTSGSTTSSSSSTSSTSGSTTSKSTTSGTTSSSTSSSTGVVTSTTTSGNSTDTSDGTTGAPAVTTTSDSGVAAITYSAVVIFAALVLVL